MTLNNIKHISGSFLNSFDNYREDFIKSYIFGEKIEENIYMKYGKDYEDCLAETEYNDYNRQGKLFDKLLGYTVVGYYDFVNDKKIIEVKTKSGRWSENMIRKSRQFRIYNYFKGDKELRLHQYNKKTKKTKIQNIGWEDKHFLEDLQNKIQEIQNFLLPYGVEICHE